MPTYIPLQWARRQIPWINPPPILEHDSYLIPALQPPLPPQPPRTYIHTPTGWEQLCREFQVTAEVHNFSQVENRGGSLANNICRRAQRVLTPPMYAHRHRGVGHRIVTGDPRGGYGPRNVFTSGKLGAVLVEMWVAYSGWQRRGGGLIQGIWRRAHWRGI